MLRLVLLGPFPFPNAPYRSQMHPFRTLEVQCLRRRGWLKKCGLPLDFRAKNRTGRSFCLPGVFEVI